jgi:hypothetical protein
MRIGIALAFLLSTSSAGAAEPAKPLFAGNDLIRLTISGPISLIASKAEQSEAPQPATLALAGAGETHPIRLSARGITRRKSEICQFPPLRIEFSQKPPTTSLFNGQGRLKLVTHCRESAGFQQHVLLEYAAYRLYNQLTPHSYRVRLAQVDYVEAGGKLKASRLGFLIEDTDDLARRNGLREARMPDRISASQLTARDAARFALFEYMIGNLDWSMRAGPAGQGCCHNSRLISAAGTAANLVPVPYDFDYSGLVDAPYAVPPEGMPVKSVRKRYYRGYCRHNADLVAVAAEVRAQRAALLATIAQVPQIAERTNRKAASFLETFFADIASDQAVAANLLKDCIS